MTKRKPYLTLAFNDHGDFYRCEVYDDRQPGRGPITTFDRVKTNPLIFDLEEIRTSANLALKEKKPA